MKAAVAIFAVMLGLAVASAEESPAGLDAFELAQSDATGESRTRPVSEPLARSAMDLSKIPYKIVHETYRETGGRRNHEIFIMNADGSNPVNLTNTPDIEEMYPHVSPEPMLRQAVLI